MRDKNTFKMKRFFACVSAAALVSANQDVGVSLNLGNDAKTVAAFEKVYEKYLNEFNEYHLGDHEKMLAELEEGMKSFLSSKAATAYKSVPGQPHCDRGVSSAVATKVMQTKGVSAFPGGVLKRVFGFDLSKHLFELSQKAAGPAAASGGMGGILAMQALGMGAGMIQSAVSAAIDIIPPMIPPPIWINQPLTCLPMVTGHNCFGAVLYPITLSDFVIADVTDAMLDGYIAGFPNTYATKVGQTSDAQYKACFASAMSMQCGSIFPRCSVPMARSEPTPIGRLPLCFTSCISTLVMCPGFWLEDIQSSCHSVSVPPMCTLATYWNMWRLPPQYVDFEDSHPTPLACPSSAGNAGADASKDYGLYDTETVGASPFTAAAGAGASSVPVAFLAPGAETADGSAYGSGSTGSAGSSSSLSGYQGAADGAAAASQLQTLISQVQGSGAGVGSSGASAPATTSAKNGAEASLRSKFEKAQVLHMRAANPMETADELAVEGALRQAISSTPSRVGRSSITGSSAASLA